MKKIEKIIDELFENSRDIVNNNGWSVKGAVTDCAT